MAADRPVPPEVLEEVRGIAVEDAAFTPRFQARQFLRSLEEPVPLDNPGGAYAFKVKFMYAKRIYRTIELRSEQTLADLNNAVQYALDWDNDHLYSFYLNGKQDDPRYEVPRIDPDEGFGSGMLGVITGPITEVSVGDQGRLFLVPRPEADAAPATDDDAAEDEEEEEYVGAMLAEDAVIGELGLTLKHKFIYLFDYGDENEFEVDVVGIRREAEPGEYPRVVDEAGSAPAQYDYGDEDEDEDEDPEE
jgi:hypothetical protein